MNTRHSVILLVVFCVMLSFVCTCKADTREAVLLESIPTLTFYNGQYTAGRRTAPIPQVRCVGGTAQSAPYQPKVVQCKNMGSDGRDIQWRCEADMDSAYRFGAIRVSCEGYNHPDDPYVLRGSCGFEYELDYTEEGKRRTEQGNQGTFTGGYGYRQSGYGSWGQDSGSSGFFFPMLILGFIVFVLWRICSAPSHGVGYGAGGGGGYGGGPDFGPGFPPGGGPYGGGCAPTYNTPVYQPGGGGFWSGMATGGLLGYLFNRRPAYGSGYGSGYGYGAPAPMYGGGSFGGGSSYSGGGGASSGGGSRTAAGFGGTTRR